jgi:hypothetical protein
MEHIAKMATVRRVHVLAHSMRKDAVECSRGIVCRVYLAPTTHTPPDVTRQPAVEYRLEYVLSVTPHAQKENSQQGVVVSIRGHAISAQTAKQEPI